MSGPAVPEIYAHVLDRALLRFHVRVHLPGGVDIPVYGRAKHGANQWQRQRVRASW